MTGDIDKLYRIRFPESDREGKNAIWRILCRHFFSRYIKPTDTILDIACGYGEFINNITAAEKFAVDLNKDTKALLHADVTFYPCSATDLSQLPKHHFDAIFMSNFLEHLATKADLLQLFSECHRLLKPEGRILILGPNIRRIPGAYWDFFDHHLPLSHFTVAEGLQLTNYAVETCIPAFLPYTTRSSLPQARWLVRLYLMVPLAWRLMGKQFFVVGRTK